MFGNWLGLLVCLVCWFAGLLVCLVCWFAWFAGLLVCLVCLVCWFAWFAYLLVCLLVWMDGWMDGRDAWESRDDADADAAAAANSDSTLLLQREERASALSNAVVRCAKARANAPLSERPVSYPM